MYLIIWLNYYKKNFCVLENNLFLIKKKEQLIEKLVLKDVIKKEHSF